MAGLCGVSGVWLVSVWWCEWYVACFCEWCEWYVAGFCEWCEWYVAGFCSQTKRASCTNSFKNQLYEIPKCVELFQISRSGVQENLTLTRP